MEFKIKHNGQKLKVRLQSPDECIKTKSLQVYFGEDAFSSVNYDKLFILKSLTYFPSNCVGERIRDGHQSRIYVEVLSKFYTGESTSV